MADEHGGGGGTSTPPWLTDGTGFDVDITKLDQFATNIQTEAENFAAGYRGGLVAMMEDDGRFGGGGLSEGTSYTSVEQNAETGLRFLLEDVGRSLIAVSCAAGVVSETYLGADAFSRATLEDTRAAFEGIEGRKLISDTAGATSSQRADQGITDPATTPGEVDQDIQEAADEHAGQDPTERAQTPDGQRVYYPDKPGEYTVPTDSNDYSRYDMTVPSTEKMYEELEDE